MTSQSYPNCITTPDNGRKYCGDGNDPAAPGFTTGMSYAHSLPVSVTGTGGLSAAYQYHPNLTLAQIDHGNTAVTLFDEDPDHLPRPRRIRVQRFGSNIFDTGLYGYDAAGNIATIGSDVYVYDAAQRLLSGTVQHAGAGKRQDYAYDLFDNVRSVGTERYCQKLCMAP